MKKHLLCCILLLASTTGYSRGELGINSGFIQSNIQGSMSGQGLYIAMRLWAEVNNMIAVGGGGELFLFNAGTYGRASPLVPMYGLLNFQLPFGFNKIYMGGAFGTALNAGSRSSIYDRQVGRWGVIGGGQLGYARTLPHQLNFNAEVAFRNYSGKSEGISFTTWYIRYGIGVSVPI